MISIGTAGWSILKELRHSFGEGNDLLQRYATYLNVTEINETFYQLPLERTFEKWGKERPENFLFTFKLHRYFSHQQKLRSLDGIEEFCQRVSHLQHKLLALLAQKLRDYIVLVEMVIFDNIPCRAAFFNALYLMERLREAQ